MSSVSCSICWDIVTATCIVSYLQCGHVYHQNCLEKWLDASRTCPECRNGVINAKRIYLNLVPDPEVETLNLALTKKTAQFQFLTNDNELQKAIVEYLEKEMNAKLLEKDEELLQSSKRNDELKSNASYMQLLIEKLKLELEMEEKQQANLTTELTDVKNQLAASQTKNIEITNSTVALKEYHREQIKQISDLHSEILNLTERLDQFRGLFVAANNKLQVQLQENEVLKNDRNSLLSRNSQLIKKNYNMKLQVGNEFNAQQLSRTIRKKYNDLPRSAIGAFQPRFSNEVDLLQTKLKNHLKTKQKLLQHHQTNNDVNLNIKLVKSKLSWICRSNQVDLLQQKLKYKSFSQNYLKKRKFLQHHQKNNDENLKIKLVKSKLNWMCVKS